MDKIPYHAYVISSITEVTITQPFDVIKTWTTMLLSDNLKQRLTLMCKPYC